ncbi:PorP/SprF family type IX secretion system membrane protein [Flavitalea sp. BT771]|uniref:PorP/SprF family type IX secretion system membrane protein n=1 Tax=Flavitalea sp. BT771 TaxID=3063329 RepID=UPI0026E3A63E|nr:PorP/SprF family type IX secretion system membrane protein [Flavitalea sp. BT771]MDO6435093.1 PorP/SprF family type IX secretion system membrane protein [Flavitalea sp. BT771]MDV6223993.1 PorP/SprF family type IX secretion system membrane protein [Flavitalea sp. BT771]
MRNYKSYIQLLILTFGILHMQSARCQDIHFSQFFEAPLLRNPSLAGIFTGDYRVQAVFRDQWSSFTNAYRTGSLNGEYKMPVGKGSDFLTAGLQLLYDKAGSAALSTTELLPALNYHKSLSDDHPMYLSLGFMGGLVEKRIDMSKVTTNSQYNGTAFDPALPDGELLVNPTVRYLDGSLGLSFNTVFGQDKANSLFFGAALHHVNRPKNSFYKSTIELDPKYVFSGGLKLTINEFAFFTVQADHTRQGSATETIGGALYSYKLGDDPENSSYILSLGSFLRWKDALIPVIKLDMNALAVSFSYDVNVSQLKTVSQGRGGIELSISYIGFTSRENAKYRILCPKF